ASVKLTLYGVSTSTATIPMPDAPLGSVVLALRDNAGLLPANTRFQPGFLELGPDAIASTAGYSRLRIDIEPTDAMTQIWTFASITNNETQHVTIIEPRP